MPLINVIISNIIFILNCIFFSLLYYRYVNFKRDNTFHVIENKIIKLLEDKTNLLETNIKKLENNKIDIELSNNLSKLSEKNIKQQQDLNELKSLVLKHHNEYHETFNNEEKRVNEKFDFINMDIKKIKKTLNDRNFI